MATTPPKWYQQFLSRYPEVGKNYEALGESVHQAGPLDEKSRALIKLAISGSSGMEQAFRVHIRKARDIGIGREEIEHVALLALPTIGFPSMMILLYSIEEEFNK